MDEMDLTAAEKKASYEEIKNAVDDFLERKREDEEIIFYEEKRIAEEDWHAEEMEALESNRK